MFDTKNDW